MKSDYRMRAFNFLRSIFPYIEKDLYSVSGTEFNVREYLYDHPSRKVEVNCGSARIALITSDYVIKWDYDMDCVKDIGGCEKENEMYQFAEREGFGYLFAAATLVNYRGITFEIMPRVRAIGPRCHKMNLLDMLSNFEESWLRSHGLLYDLHDYNWGIMSNKPVIIDYAYIEYE